MRTKIALTIVVNLCVISLLRVVCGCRRVVPAELLRVEALIEDSPDSALSILDSIRPDALSAENRHYRDLLYIKASDKAYVTHDSDSLILDVIDYYSSGNTPLYAEALYYGGRVYSDMGDYPSAIRYFQNSLDFLTENKEDLELRSRVESQMARLLITIRLYDQAKPFLEDAIQHDNILGDSISLMYDTQLLGSLYFLLNEFNKSENEISKALLLAKVYSKSDVSMLKTYNAAIKYKKGDYDAAHKIIKSALEGVDSLSRDFALAYGAKIYLASGIKDTAYHYGRELYEKRDSYNREVGFEIIMSPQLKSYMTEDSLRNIAEEYISFVDSCRNVNNLYFASIQQAEYNYKKHELEKAKAEASRDLFRKIFYATVF